MSWIAACSTIAAAEVGPKSLAAIARSYEGDLVLCANCGLELKRVGAELLGVGREDEAGERGLVDEGVRRGRR